MADLHVTKESALENLGQVVEFLNTTQRCRTITRMEYGIFGGDISTIWNEQLRTIVEREYQALVLELRNSTQEPSDDSCDEEVAEINSRQPTEAPNSSTHAPMGVEPMNIDERTTQGVVAQTTAAYNCPRDWTLLDNTLSDLAVANISIGNDHGIFRRIFNIGNVTSWLTTMLGQVDDQEFLSAYICPLARFIDDL